VGQGDKGELVFLGCDFRRRQKIVRTINSDAILSQQGIDPLEAARIEGHVGYGVVSQAVGQALGVKREYELSKLFPAIDFGNSIKLDAISNGGALGIFSTDEVKISRSAHCECTEGPDYEVSRSTIISNNPSDVNTNDEIGSVNVGGPVPDNKNPLIDFGPRYHGDGHIGLYIPISFAEELTPQVMPAIKIVASDNGTVGYRAEANVGFNNFRLSIDETNWGLILDIDLDISVSAYCDFEVFKGLRLPIGWAIVMPAQGSRARLKIGFYPSVDSSGTITLKSTLRECDMGNYVAVVIGIGTALKFLGVTAWIGFLIDVVLAAILSNGLPHELKKALRKHIGANEWKLVDGLPTYDPTKPLLPPAAIGSADATSLLVSFGRNG
jgi:hypothetical protein